MKLDFERKSNGMYIISRVGMDKVAREFLSEYAPNALTKAEPVGISSIAEEHLGLTLKYQNLSPNGEISGLVTFGDTEYDCYDRMFRPVKLEIADGTILIDVSLSKEISYPRRRYTIAHEVSHRLLHRSYRSPSNKQFSFRGKHGALIACRAGNIERPYDDGGTKTDPEWEEWQADALAAAILMPKDTFGPLAETMIHSRTGTRFLSQATPREIRQDIIKRIAGAFVVSHRATEIRLKHLKLMQ